MEIPADVHLMDPHKFNQRYEKYAQECRTYEEAYQQTERDYRRIFGVNKYASYDSFRVVRSRWMKAARENKKN